MCPAVVQPLLMVPAHPTPPHLSPAPERRCTCGDWASRGPRTAGPHHLRGFTHTLLPK
ncbi:hypothetical protein P7K49_030009, partial [Saguinus oedipus]